MALYARLKGRLRFTAPGSTLLIHLKRPHAYRPISHHDPVLPAHLLPTVSTLPKAHYPD
jgi:DNA-binding transcriptional regulator PaaX